MHEADDMAKLSSFWRVAVSTASAIAVLAAVVFAFTRLWGWRDRPQLSERVGQPDRGATMATSEALAPTDWPQFRGPGGSCASIDATIPLEWGDNTNISWKTRLPGPGLSSPIVVGDRVFVTCYSGYGTEDVGSDDVRKLKRHLLCLNRLDGEIGDPW